MFREHFIIFTAFLVINTSGSALHGECETDEHCGTFDTYCKKGTCVCKENFAVVHDTCVALAVPPASCIRRTDCHPILGSKSICKDAQCACKTFHHLHSGQCVKSRGLDEVCESDHQCYCGENCQDKIECAADRICRCKPGHIRIHRRCISNFANGLVVSQILLAALLLSNKIL